MAKRLTYYILAGLALGVLVGWAINASDMVVGTADTLASGQHAFLFDTQMRDLNSLIAPGSGWNLIIAFDITDNGLITGYGTFGGTEHSFLLTPIGVQDVRVADSINAVPNEVRYHCVNAAHSVFRPDLTPSWVPEQYGGMCTEVNAATGGLLASASAVALAIGHYAVWGLGGRAPGSSRIGSMAGTFTCASSLNNGLDWTVLFNGNDGLNDAVRGQFLMDVNNAISAV